MVDWDYAWKAFIVAAGISVLGGYYLRENGCSCLGIEKQNNNNNTYEHLVPKDPSSDVHRPEVPYSGLELTAKNDRD